MPTLKRFVDRFVGRQEAKPLEISISPRGVIHVDSSSLLDNSSVKAQFDALKDFHCLNTPKKRVGKK